MKGMEIGRVFDVDDVGHLKEYRYLVENGCFPKNSIFSECDMSNPVWQIVLMNNLALAYLREKLDKNK